ncbi:stalk domain-containing protein [Paenibacillus alginolyticus]|uniref:Stalk domain-containing protein n=1 Tax=Paenibacillus alginolyticus TaxID=59839 RepID=A0ABT4GG99_9BACL|nr:stalk domain-containing protein [Paenibacillus alginolyticus]MCY9695215.1 stalk domain-containing protein [Paenibacillus alginolyticus]MEC0145172.1 stalk domain-containing protein [Paenibacillus alginolyticus]
MAKRLLTKNRWASFLFFMLFLWSLPITAFAAASDLTSTPVYQDEMKVNDSGVVWTSFDNEAHRQVYYSTKFDGAPLAITQSVGIREKPIVGGNLVVWQEARREWRGEGSYDIYAYNLETKEERKLTSNNEGIGSVTTDGRYVAWIDEMTRIVNLYDWQTKQTSQIGKGNNPVVAKGKLAYGNHERNQILLYQPTDHSSKTLITVPKSLYLSGFQFNGDWLLYLSQTQTYAYKVSLQKADGTSEPAFESGSDTVAGNMDYMSLNERFAVYPVYSSGKGQYMAIELSTGQVKPVTAHGEYGTMIGLQGDSLYYSPKNDRIQSLSISTTPARPKGADTLTSNGSNSSQKNPDSTPSKPHDPDQLIVVLDEKEIAFQVNPVVENGSTMVQFRPLFEAMGVSIEWREEDQTIIGTKNKFRIELKMGDKTALVNGKAMDLPIAPHTINDSTMVPLRFVAESMGRSVYWVPSYTEKEVRIKQTVASDILDNLYSDNLVYHGETKDGVPNGNGTYTKDGQLWYHGQFANGVMEGEGAVYRNGKIFYDGDMKANLPNGNGKLFDLGLYVGQVVNGMRQGVGKYYEKNGALIYSGQFTADTETGKGTIYESNGTRYVGDVIMGVREGNAEVYDQDGDLEYKGRYAGNHQVLRDPQLTYLAMMLYAEAGKDVKANAMFEKAKKSDDRKMVPYYMIADTYIVLKKPDKANEYIQAGSAVDSKDPILNAYLALTYALQNKSDQAKAQMDKAKGLGLEKTEIWDARLKEITAK